MRNQITLFRGAHFFLSNFSPSKIEVMGLTFHHVEGAFQAMKTFNFRHREDIARLKEPISAKGFGQTVRLRPDWEQIKYEVMVLLLRLKFRDLVLRRLLLQTEDAELIEDTTNRRRHQDRIWGAVWDGARWQGQNLLGRALMELRTEMQRGAEMSEEEVGARLAELARPEGAVA